MSSLFSFLGENTMDRDTTTKASALESPDIVGKDTIDLARQLITTTTVPIDIILSKFNITHEEYRKYYPETPVTACLALDVLEHRGDMSLSEIQAKWSLSRGQAVYALYDDSAIVPKQHDNSLKYIVLKALRADPTRTQTSIADANNVSQSYVHGIAKEYGLLRPRKKRIELTEQQLQTIYSAVDNGTSVETLAKSYGVARDTIYKKLRMR